MKKILFSVFVLAGSLLLAFNFAGEASAKTKKSAATSLGTTAWAKSALTAKARPLGLRHKDGLRCSEKRHKNKSLF